MLALGFLPAYSAECSKVDLQVTDIENESDQEELSEKVLIQNNSENILTDHDCEILTNNIRSSMDHVNSFQSDQGGVFGEHMMNLVRGKEEKNNLNVPLTAKDINIENTKDDIFLISDYMDNDSLPLHNLTMLEDFEVFDGRDVLNVVAYALMSAGETVGLVGLLDYRAVGFCMQLSLSFLHYIIIIIIFKLNNFLSSTFDLKSCHYDQNGYM